MPSRIPLGQILLLMDAQNAPAGNNVPCALNTATGLRGTDGGRRDRFPLIEAQVRRDYPEGRPEPRYETLVPSRSTIATVTRATFTRSCARMLSIDPEAVRCRRGTLAQLHRRRVAGSEPQELSAWRATPPAQHPLSSLARDDVALEQRSTLRLGVAHAKSKRSWQCRRRYLPSRR